MSAANWSECSLDSLCSVERGRSRHRPRNDPRLFGGPYPFVQTAEVTAADCYINSAAKTYSEFGLAQSRLWQPGAICIVNAGENTGSVGVLNIAACFPDSIIALSPIAERADRMFIFYLVKTLRSTYRTVTKGATQDNLSIDKLLSFPVRVPPLPTQRRIASILSAYDDLIENNTRRTEILEEMARSLFREVAHEAGDSCRTMSLGEIADADNGTIRTGPFGSQLHQSDYSETGIPVVMPKDIVDGKLDDASIARVPASVVERLSQHVLDCGDIVYGRRGDIGRRAYIAKENAGWLCGTGCLRISLKGAVLDTRYLYEFLGQPHIVELIAGRAVGATMPNLNTSILRSVPVQVPSRVLQQRYANTVSPITEMRNILVQKNKVLCQTRDLLLPKLISGKIDVDSLDLPEPS